MELYVSLPSFELFWQNVMVSWVNSWAGWRFVVMTNASRTAGPKEILMRILPEQQGI